MGQYTFVPSLPTPNVKYVSKNIYVPSCKGDKCFLVPRDKGVTKKMFARFRSPKHVSLPEFFYVQTALLVTSTLNKKCCRVYKKLR